MSEPELDEASKRRILEHISQGYQLNIDAMSDKEIDWCDSILYSFLQK